MHKICLKNIWILFFCLRYAHAFAKVTVEKSSLLHIISEIVGWIYFLAWSISFYPQMYWNYKRKSVVGLSFDFLSLNLLGFVMYSLFNCGLYWIPIVEVFFIIIYLIYFYHNKFLILIVHLQEQYFSLHPKGLNPVQINDIFFALHAVFATLVTIIQCFIYEVKNNLNLI